MDEEDPCIPALFLSEAFYITHSFFFFLYSGLQARTDSGSTYFQEHVCFSAHKTQIPSSFLQIHQLLKQI